MENYDEETNRDFSCHLSHIYFQLYFVYDLSNCIV